MYRQDGAAATEFVVGAAEGDRLELEDGKCTSTHDAWLTCHIQMTPA